METLVRSGNTTLRFDTVSHDMDWNRFERTLASQQLAGDESVPSDVFEILSTEDARYAVYALAHEPDRTLSQLADVVAGFAAMRSGTVATPSDHENARIRLHHAVLPKLDAANYVAYDRSDRTIEAGPRHDVVNAALGFAG